MTWVGIAVAVLLVAWLVARPTKSSHGQSEACWPERDQCVVCGRYTIYRFRGRPLCPDCRIRKGGTR